MKYQKSIIIDNMLLTIQALNAGASLLLAFLTFSNASRVNKRANQWLGLFFACIFLLCLDDLLEYQKTYESYPHLIGLVEIVSLLLVPFLYLSVLHFVNPIEKWKITNLKHFGLLLLFVLFSFSFLCSNSAVKLATYQADAMIHPDLMSAIVLLFFLQAFVYGKIMLKKLKAHQKNIQLFSAKGETIQLGWLTNSVRAFLVMIFFWFLYLIFQTEWLYSILNIILLVGIFLLAYFSIHQQEIFPTNVMERTEVIKLILAEEQQPNTTNATVLTAEETKSLNQKLLETMETQKPYLDNELNLPKLAEFLAIPSYKLSYLLNNHIGENFSTFINKYRVIAAKQVLANPKMGHLTLVQVAYEAGYNSKTVFNTHFKKIVGISPSAYRKKFK